MGKNLISGLYKKLYKRINETKKREGKLSKYENEAMAIINELIEFVNRNPDITNDDLKLLATGDKTEKYLALFYSYFPDLIAEFKENSAKNLISTFRNKIEYILSADLAYKLNKHIQSMIKANPKRVTITINNEHNYKRLNLTFVKVTGDKTDFYESYEDISGSTSYVYYKTDIEIKDVCQILGLVSFYQSENISEKHLRKIVKQNVIYDFSVIEELFNNTESIQEELDQDNYGIIKLCLNYQSYILKKEDLKK